MNNLAVGILAHVDAGKTTLSECLLYNSGAIRNMGRVDKKDAYLDTHAIEKERGITIFSKQALLRLGDYNVTLIDTPGHTDFSAETFRALAIMDYAILVINGAEGVQSHSVTLMEYLERFHIPTYIFVNKMDQQRRTKAELIRDIKDKLKAPVYDFDNLTAEDLEELAMTGEAAMETYLETGDLPEDVLSALIKERRAIPCYFGSALKNEGVIEFINGMSKYMQGNEYPKEFGARAYKISRDESGARLTFLKITGGSLHVKSDLEGEKINQIRMYSGSRYEAVSTVTAGMVCAVVGPVETYAGEGFGLDEGMPFDNMGSVLTYRLVLPDKVDPITVLPGIRQLEEEEPELNVIWDDRLGEIHVCVMGSIQLEILTVLIKDRIGIDVSFDSGSVLYKETIRNRVEGVGHFEPLRHYSEVHLIMEPGEAGSGITIRNRCSTDILAKRWQHLVLTHIREKTHKGVLTGSPLTDVVITLASGRAHEKHTMGGDFRQATYRAIRQGLMQAENVLLEPYYDFTINIPSSLVGRVMMDVEKMHGRLNPPEIDGDRALITGRAPVITLKEYPEELTAASRGEGRISFGKCTYDICHNSDEIIEEKAYDPDADTRNPSYSVFCAHGGEDIVMWNEVFSRMHLDAVLGAPKGAVGTDRGRTQRSVAELDIALGTEEIDRILRSASHANSSAKSPANSWKYRTGENAKETVRDAVKKQDAQHAPLPRFVLVDGYNVIHAWSELDELRKESYESARGRLLDILCNYAGATGCEVIAVFDAYKVQGHSVSYMDYNNIHVVYTAEAQTADAYIERFTHDNSGRYDITVVTSDGLEQVIIRGAGARLISSREFETEARRINDELMQRFGTSSPKQVRTPI